MNHIVPAIIVLAFAGAIVTMALMRKKSDPAATGTMEAAWAAAMEHDSASPVARMLLSVSKPVTQVPGAAMKPESSLYKALRIKLAAASGVYGGSVEVFVSVQIMSVLIAAGCLVATIALQLSGMLLGGVSLFAIALAAMPYNRIHVAATKRIDAVSAGLPEFADLLLMPVTSGYGIIPALDFTASRLDGPVAAEVRMMLQILASRASSEQAAFLDTGERLGTPASITFFNTLYQSYVGGTRVGDTIRSQAEALRQQAFENARAKRKALPNKLVVIMGLHLIPFLFAVVLLPTFLALGQM